MKTLLLFLLTFFMHSSFSEEKGCTHDLKGSQPSVDKDISALNLNNCIDTFYDFDLEASVKQIKKGTCECSQKELAKYKIPLKKNEIESHKNHQKKLFEKAKINLLDISNDLSLLNSNPTFRDSNLGEVCSIEKLNITSCSLNQDQMKELTQLQCNFQKELSTQLGKDYSPVKGSLCGNLKINNLTDRNIKENQYSCSNRIPEQMIAEIQLQKNISILEKLQPLIKNAKFSGLLHSTLENVTDNTPNFKLASQLTATIGNLPILRTLNTNADFFEAYKKGESVKDLLDKKNVLQQEMTNMVEKCSKTYNRLEQTLCNPLTENYPSDLEEFITSLEDDFDDADNVKINKEIAFYCKSKNFKFEDIAKDLKEVKSAEAKDYRTFDDASKNIQQKNIINPAKSVCDALSGSDEEVIKKIDQCKKSQDSILDEKSGCLNLIAFDSLYGDAFRAQVKVNKKRELASTSKSPTTQSSTSETEEMPSESTFYQILNRDSKLLSSFRGEEIKTPEVELPKDEAPEKVAVADQSEAPAPAPQASTSSKTETIIAGNGANQNAIKGSKPQKQAQATHHKSNTPQMSSHTPVDYDQVSSDLLDEVFASRKRRDDELKNSSKSLSDEIEQLKSKIASTSDDENSSKEGPTQPSQSKQDESYTSNDTSNTKPQNYTNHSNGSSQGSVPLPQGVASTPDSAPSQEEKEKNSINKALAEMNNNKASGAATGGASRGPASIASPSSASPISISQASAPGANGNEETIPVLEVSNNLDNDLQVLVDQDMAEIDQIKELVEKEKSFYISKKGRAHYKVLMQRTNNGFKLVPQGDTNDPQYVQFVKNLKRSITVQQHFKNIFGNLNDINSMFN